MLDNNLSWDNHVNYITKKISKFVPLLYNVRTKLLKDNLKLVYNAIKYPLLIYCNVVWGSCCKTYLCNLNIIQKKLDRIMSFRNRFEHTTPLFSNYYNMLTIENINKYMSIIRVHKYLHSDNNIISLHCMYQWIKALD